VSAVRIPGPLQALAEGMKEVEVHGATVEAVLAELVQHYPHLRRHLFEDGGALRGYVNLYLNDEDVRFLDGLSTPLNPDDVITIVPSVAGG
jgi:molybdopterin synthase sulfur carrier subunit